MGRNGKPRNRRVVTVEHLRKIKRWAATVTQIWAEVGGRIYLTSEELEAKRAETGKHWPGVTRPRELHEWPENDPAHWDQLARYMLAIHSESAEIYRWAKEQAERTRARLAETGASA